MNKLMSRLREESGVAMVTVIFVAAIMTVVASAGTLLTILELGAGRSDRDGSQALSYAEAGIDRFVTELRSGTYGWQALIHAGCEAPPLALPPGLIGNGKYAAEVVVYDPTAVTPADRLPPAACGSRPVTPGRAATFAITSTGNKIIGGTTNTSSASRLVRQVVQVGWKKVPVGIFAGSVDANGNVSMDNISLVVTGDIVGRDKISFTGTDPFYLMSDFYGPAASSTTHIPAAAHTLGAIYFKSGGGNKGRAQEHPPNPNCGANPRGTLGQSLWDGSGAGGTVTTGCVGQTGYPPTSKFTGLYGAGGTTSEVPTSLSEEDYALLKESAMIGGIYCNPSGACTKQGASIGSLATISSATMAGLGATTVVYIEYPTSGDPFKREITWGATVGPCSDDPLVNRSAIVVVRNGSAKMGAGSTLNGALLTPEGQFDSAGNFVLQGTLLTKHLRLRGAATLSLTDCWVRNIPGALLDVSLGRWAELDR